MSSLLDARAGIGQPAEALAIGVAPWRFAFSARFRERVNERRRRAPPHVAAVQQLGGALVVRLELLALLPIADAIRPA